MKTLAFTLVSLIAAGPGSAQLSDWIQLEGTKVVNYVVVGDVVMGMGLLSQDGFRRLYRSTDSGVTWEEVELGNVHLLVPFGENQIAVATSDEARSRLWLITASGEAEELTGPPSDGPIFGLVESGVSGNKATLAAMASGIWRQEGSGAWEMVVAPTTYLGYPALTNVGDRYVWASAPLEGTSGTILESSDGGRVWSETGFVMSRPRFVRGQQVLVTGGQMVFYTEGDPIRLFASRGIGGEAVFAPAERGFVAFQSGIMYQSAGGTVDFEPIGWDSLPHAGLSAVAVTPDGHILVYTDAKMFRSRQAFQ